MTGGWRTPSRPSPGYRGTWTIWARHDRIVVRGVKVWLPILTGMAGPDAVAELTVRQDRLRRSNEPCRLVMLEDGRTPQ